MLTPVPSLPFFVLNHRCKADPSIERKIVGDFQFPLGVYPVEDLTPVPGYTLDFEPADGGEDGGSGGGDGRGARSELEDLDPDGSEERSTGGGGGDGNEWEEWPDRYVFDAVLSAERVPSLVRAILHLMPLKVYPILDVLGHDAFREVDPYVSYELIGTDRVHEAIRQVPDFFFEDGLCGFGCMSEEPFMYFFVDEHKIITLRAEASVRERIERLLQSFDLTQTDAAAGADAAAHEHRGVLHTSPSELNLMDFDEIVERLREDWRLVLNIDPESNLDDEGKDLGVTAWWCRIRVAVPQLSSAPVNSTSTQTPSTPAKTSPKPPAKNKNSQNSEDSTPTTPSPTPTPAPHADEDTEILPTFSERHAEIVLGASCLREAEEVAIAESAKLAGPVPEGLPPPIIVFADRITSEQLEDYVKKHGRRRTRGMPEAGQIVFARWAR